MAHYALMLAAIVVAAAAEAYTEVNVRLATEFRTEYSTERLGGENGLQVMRIRKREQFQR